MEKKTPKHRFLELSITKNVFWYKQKLSEMHKYAEDITY